LNRIFASLLCLVFSGVVQAAPKVVQGISTRITSLDPFTLADIEAFGVVGNALEPLARLDPKTGELIPCLAESWEVRTDGPTIRIRLRDGVRFQNGEKLTSSDVKFTFDAYLDPQFKGEAWRAMWEGIESAKAVDARTVDFRVKKIRYQSLENLLTSLRILPASVYAKSTSVFRQTHLVGTGPFKLKLFTSGRQVEFIPHHDWWAKEAPQFDLLVKPVADASLARTLMDRGELDDFWLPTAEAPRFLNYAHLRRLSAVRGEGVWLNLNLKNPLFADVRLREALGLVWDRETLNKKVFGGEFRLALDSFSPRMVYYPPGSVQNMDLVRAREILKEAGWTDSNRDGVLDQKLADGQLRPLKFEILFRSNQDERWLTLYQADAARVGIGVLLRRVEDESRWWKLLQEGKYDVGASTGGLDTGVMPGAFHSKGFYNITGYAREEVDRDLDRLDSEFNSGARAAIQRRLILRIRQDRVTVPGLYSIHSYFLISSRLDVDPEVPTYPWKWRLKDRQKP
jgi:peptide/nickel transport system substrate-binding protein